jgi:hypothetical protein
MASSIELDIKLPLLNLLFLLLFLVLVRLDLDVFRADGEDSGIGVTIIMSPTIHGAASGAQMSVGMLVEVPDVYYGVAEGGDAFVAEIHVATLNATCRYRQIWCAPGRSLLLVAIRASQSANRSTSNPGHHRIEIARHR